MLSSRTTRARNLTIQIITSSMSSPASHPPSSASSVSEPTPEAQYLHGPPTHTTPLRSQNIASARDLSSNFFPTFPNSPLKMIQLKTLALCSTSFHPSHPQFPKWAKTVVSPFLPQPIPTSSNSTISFISLSYISQRTPLLSSSPIPNPEPMHKRCSTTPMSISAVSPSPHNTSLSLISTTLHPSPTLLVFTRSSPNSNA